LGIAVGALVIGVSGCGGGATTKPSSAAATATDTSITATTQPTLTTPTTAPSVGSSSSTSSGPSASSYAKTVCTAVQSWVTDIESRSSTLNSSTITSAAEGKAVLVSYFGEAINDTSTVVTKLRAAGVPDVSNGSSISASLISAFIQVRTALSQGQAQAQALPTNDPAKFKSAADALGKTVQSSLTSIGKALGGLKSPELVKAAATEPACKSLNNS
jgi:hypothetical protein